MYDLGGCRIHRDRIRIVLAPGFLEFAEPALLLAVLAAVSDGVVRRAWLHQREERLVGRHRVRVWVWVWGGQGRGRPSSNRLQRKRVRRTLSDARIAWMFSMPMKAIWVFG